ncbi:transcriptional attenuator, LytR family [Haloechinothrix alba]|uniref:Transcriptional attenuator, LytR family n=1 Tax=Haloechinothrix alba TaxID=664784 RepID=A0A238ZCA6_9PSEU|nr:LCP family protein [Haloechinothrix alba]SNR80344.1 transcriptional attenuator, LytR family [Haloechinothrix alba]
MDNRPRPNRRERRPSRPWLDQELETTPALPRVNRTEGRAASDRQRSGRGSGTQRGRGPGTSGARTSRRAPLRGAKIALALVSLLVMSATGYAWGTLHGMGQGLTVADVIGDEGGGHEPADGSRDILLIGVDSRTDAQGNEVPLEELNEINVGEADGQLNTDTIIHVHIPNDGSRAVAVSIPRDSYVDIPGYGRHKINSAFARGKTTEERRLRREGVTDENELEVRSDQEGARTLIETVEALTGRTIDNYASVNFFGFLEITEAIGGVEVCLKEPVEDYDSGVDFDAGVQTISGADALGFVRQRHGLPRGDLDRVVRQQAFMAGLANKVLSTGTLTNPRKLNDLMDAFKKAVVLDQDWDVMGFAEQMSGLAGGQIEFHTIPVMSLSMDTRDGSAVQVDPAQVRDFFAELSGDEQDDGESEQVTEQDNSDITVNVMNTTTVPGLAADVADSLTGKGFVEGLVSNATARDTTVVRYAPGERDKADRVAEALDGPGRPEEDPALTPGQITVLLGSDFRSAELSADSAGGRTPQSEQEGPDAPDQDPGGPGANPDEPGSEDSDGEPITADGVTCVN